MYEPNVWLEHYCRGVTSVICVMVPLDLGDLGDTVLHQAVRLNCFWAVHFYGIQAADDWTHDLNARNSTGATALFLAAHEGHLEIARCLVSCGAMVDAADDDGTTPLIQAAWLGHLEVVRFLVSDGGAVVDATNALGYTALIAMRKYRQHA